MTITKQKRIELFKKWAHENRFMAHWYLQSFKFGAPEIERRTKIIFNLFKRDGILSSRTNYAPNPEWVFEAFEKVVVFLLVFAWSLGGCVSLSTYHRAQRESYIKGLQKARRVAYQLHCQDAVDIISGKIDVEEMK
jgi:hypothetical protein